MPSRERCVRNEETESVPAWAVQVGALPGLENCGVLHFRLTFLTLVHRDFRSPMGTVNDANSVELMTNIIYAVSEEAFFLEGVFIHIDKYFIAA